MKGITLRAATLADVDGLASMHVASWRETYTGIMPDELLASHSVETRAAMWTNILGNREAFGCAEVLIAHDLNRIIAFGSCGEPRDRALADAGFDSEIGGLYVLRSHQKRGIGHSIMAAMSEFLSGLGYKGAYLWVLRDNGPARTFYESLGGRFLAERQDERFEGAIAEVAYGWSDWSDFVR